MCDKPAVHRPARAWQTAIAVGLGALIVSGGWAPEPLRAQQGAASVQSANQSVSPSRALLDRYCVTCHNERLKTGGVMFDAVDLGRADLHRELLEKVVRKLRSDQMPPQGRPRPDRRDVTTFVAALEAELDRVAAAAPNPGRVSTRRMNRTEYVNAIQDLLDLEIDGEALLPSDMAGFGFDNNAEVLAMTPALMERYITAASKISWLAVGTLENRPIIQTYRVPTGARQDARMGEGLPFATHGGLAVRHNFSLDGDYLFKIQLGRNDGGGTIGGNIAEREYHVELRIDHALVERLSVGGKFKGQVKYSLSIAPPEDDIVHRQVALYSMSADEDLEVRVPVKAGPRLVSVGTPTWRRRRSRARATPWSPISHRLKSTVHSMGRSPARRPVGRASSSAPEQSRERGAVREADPQHADPPCVSAPGHRPRPPAVDGVLRARARRRGLRERDCPGA